MYSLKGKKIWVAGETGLVGRGILRALKDHDVDILSAPRRVLDLTDQRATFDWIAADKPDAIFMAAARVGGIGANSAYPADFIRDNLAIAGNVIEGAHKAGVENLLFLGSSCIYPRDAEQPIPEESLMTGPLEQTNEAYAIAKIAGLKLCEFYAKQYGRRYMAAMPTNLYGPHDRFDAENAHVIPAMMVKFHAAAMSGAADVTFWGTGRPLREFLHVDDLARALIVMMERHKGAGIVNIGSGVEISIRDLAHKMKEVTRFQGQLHFDASKPDGTPRKLLNSDKMRTMGWTPSVDFADGLSQAYRWYCENIVPPMKKSA